MTAPLSYPQLAVVFFTMMVLLSSLIVAIASFAWIISVENRKPATRIRNSRFDFENMVLIRFVFVKRKSITLWISIANIVPLVYCMLLRLLVYHLDKQQHTISKNMYKERGLMGLHVGFRIKKKGF